MDTAFLKWLRLLGAVEGVSTLFLFGVAMPLKYFYAMPLAVSIAGSLHGALFVALVVMNSIAIQRVPIGLKLCVAGVMGAVIPFGPFVVDHWLKRLPDELEAAPASR